jgi:hypothetical protein
MKQRHSINFIKLKHQIANRVAKKTILPLIHVDFWKRKNYTYIANKKPHVFPLLLIHIDGC